MDSPWKIELRPRADRGLEALPSHLKSEAIEALSDLRLDPLGPKTGPLENHRRYRKVYLSHGYRIIYTVSEPHRKIVIHRIRPHDDVYSGFGD